MLDLIAVMYMYCNMMLTNIDANSSDIAHKAIVQVYPQFVQNPVQVPNPQNDANVNIDYQEELKKLGYLKEDTEDKDLNLRNAIIHFQSDHNLLTNGTWDDQGLNVLEKRLGDKSFTSPDTISKAPSSKKWITINKTKRILTLYENTSVVKKYPVAVGNPPSLTPIGKFTIVCKVKNPDWGGGGYAKPVKGGTPENPLGYRWMGLSVGGGSEYGVHGNNRPYSIGTDASHGCVRMVNADVESLFEIVPIGTIVWIGTEENLAEWGISQKEYGT